MQNMYMSPTKYEPNALTCTDSFGERNMIWNTCGHKLPCILKTLVASRQGEPDPFVLFIFFSFDRLYANISTCHDTKHLLNLDLHALEHRAKASQGESPCRWLRLVFVRISGLIRCRKRAWNFVSVVPVSINFTAMVPRSSWRSQWKFSLRAVELDRTRVQQLLRNGTEVFSKESLTKSID